MNSNRSDIFRPRAGLALLLIVALLLPGTWGCTVFRERVPAFDGVAIQSEIEREKKGPIKGDLEAYTTLKGVVVGIVTGVPSFAVLGLGIGSAVAAITCSPTLLFYPFCFVVIAVGSFAIGAVVGLFAGGIMGGIGGLPSETAEQVTAALSRLEEDVGFDEDLSNAIKAVVPLERQRPIEEAEAIVTGQMRKFDLRQHAKDRLSIRLRLAMIQSWTNDDGKVKERVCKYRYDSDKRPANTWLRGGGRDAFRAAVVDGFETFARWMERDLEAFTSGVEFKKSDEGPASCFRERRWYRWFYIPQFG